MKAGNGIAKDSAEVQGPHPRRECVPEQVSGPDKVETRWPLGATCIAPNSSYHHHCAAISFQVEVTEGELIQSR